MRRLRPFGSRLSPRGQLPVLAASLSLIAGGLLFWQVAAQATTVSYTLQLDGDLSAASYGNFTGSPPAGSFDWYDASGTLGANHGFLAPCGGTGPACTADPERGNAIRPAGDVEPTVTLPNAGYPNYEAVAAQPDYPLPDPTVFTTGSKDTLPVSGWTCTQKNNIGAKDDLLNTYQVAYTASNGDLLIGFGAEKSSDLGDNNIAIWLLQDNAVNCDSTGGSTSFSGSHKNGDVLLAASFTNGGGTASINVYEWGGCGNGAVGTACTPTSQGTLSLVGTSSQECAASPGNTLPPSGATVPVCATTNINNLNVPWTAPAKTSPGTGQLAPEEFYEGALDVTQLLGATATTTPCFNTTITDTRSSQSDTATIFDFTRGQLATCGTLDVQKYIDQNLNSSPDAGEPTSGTVVSGWQFSVTGPSPSTTEVCHGTTTSTGQISCPNLQPGTYSVAETVPAVSASNAAPAPATNPAPTWFNTDPGPVPSQGTTVTKTIVVGSGTATSYVGNECFVNEKFQINSAPVGATAPQAITVNWTINSGHTIDGTTNGSIALMPTTSTSGVWTGLVENYFVQDDNVTWSWTVTDFSGHTSTAQTGGTFSLTSDGYSTSAPPGCMDTEPAAFSLPVVGGVKFKDANHDGTRDSYTNPLTTTSALEPLLSGFTMNLYTNSSCTGTPVASTTSQSTADGNGFNYSFGGRAPGDYYVGETAETGWAQTAPVVSGAVETCIPVTAALGDTSDAVSDIGNTPLSDIGATFTTASGSTTSRISCTSSDGTTSLPASTTSGSYAANGVVDGTYTCTIVVADP